MRMETTIEADLFQTPVISSNPPPLLPGQCNGRIILDHGYDRCKYQSNRSPQAHLTRTSNMSELPLFSTANGIYLSTFTVTMWEWAFLLTLWVQLLRVINWFLNIPCHWHIVLYSFLKVMASNVAPPQEENDNESKVRQPLSPMYFVRSEEFDTLLQDMSRDQPVKDKARMPYLVVLTGSYGA